MNENPIRDSGYWCCGYKILKITDNTIFIGELFCRKCKKFHDVVIINGRQAVFPEQMEEIS